MNEIKELVNKVIEGWRKDINKNEYKYIREYLKNLPENKISSILFFKPTKNREFLNEVMLYETVFNIAYSGETSDLEFLLFQEPEKTLKELAGMEG